MSHMLHSGAPGAHSQAADKWWPDDGAQRSGPRHRKPSRPQMDGRRYAQPYPERAAGQPQAAARPARKQELNTSSVSRILMYAFVALLLTLSFVQIGRLAQIAAQTKKISSLTASIREMQNEKSNLTVRLSMQQNINRVRDEAVYNLGMIHPEDGQIRVVSLNGHSVNALTQTADSGGASGAAE